MNAFITTSLYILAVVVIVYAINKLFSKWFDSYFNE